MVADLEHGVSHSTLTDRNKRRILHHIQKAFVLSTKVVWEPGFILENIVSIPSSEGEIELCEPVFSHFKSALVSHSRCLDILVLDVRLIEIIKAFDHTLFDQN